MPRTCTICSHPQRDAIEEALIAREPLRNIAERFQVSVGSLFRHGAGGHISEKLSLAQEADTVLSADNLIAQLKALQARALTILSQAEEERDRKAALSAIREARGNLELLAKLLGQLDESPKVNVLFAPEWVQVRSVLLTALSSYPEARQAAAQALVNLESSNGHR